MRKDSAKKRHLKNTLRVLVAVGALYLVFRGMDPAELKQTLLKLNLGIFIAALILYVLSQLIFVARWCLLLKVQNIKINFLPAVRLHFLGLFYNNCLPSSVGGDLLRAWYVTKHTDKKLEAALSVFVDRIIGLFALLLMASTSFFFVPEEAKRDFYTEFSKLNFLEKFLGLKWFFAGLGVFIVLVIIFLLFVPWGKNYLKRLIDLIKLKGLHIAAKTHNAFKIYWGKKFALLSAVLLSFATQGVFITGLWLIGKQLGIPADGKFYFVFFPVSWLIGTLPISPGGGGVIEWALKIMFTRLPNVAASQAVIIALCQRAILLLASLPGFIIHMMGAHLPKDFFIDYEEPLN